MSNSSMKQSDMLLGMGNEKSVLTTIIEQAEAAVPRISEYQFEREVVDLLADPFNHNNLLRYSQYVGELTKPLRVVANDDPHNVLFEVPPLVQSPTVTIAKRGGMTAERFLYSLQRDEALGRNVNEKISNFMMNMTQIPNYVAMVVQPLQQILQRYNRQMVSMDGLPKTPAAPAPTRARTDAPVDDYED